MGLLAEYVASQQGSNPFGPPTGAPAAQPPALEPSEYENTGHGIAGFLGNIGSDIGDIVSGVFQLAATGVKEVVTEPTSVLKEIATLGFADTDVQVATPAVIPHMVGAIVSDIDDRYLDGDTAREFYDHPLSFGLDLAAIAGGAGFAGRAATGSGMVASRVGRAVIGSQAQLRNAELLNAYRAARYASTGVPTAAALPEGVSVAATADGLGVLDAAEAGVRGIRTLGRLATQARTMTPEARRAMTLDWLVPEPLRIADRATGAVFSPMPTRNPLLRSVWSDPIRRRFFADQVEPFRQEVRALEALEEVGQLTDPVQIQQLDQMRTALGRMETGGAHYIAKPWYATKKLHIAVDGLIGRLTSAGRADRERMARELAGNLKGMSPEQIEGLSKMLEGLDGNQVLGMPRVALEESFRANHNIGLEDGVREFLLGNIQVTPDEQAGVMRMLLDGQIEGGDLWRYDPPDELVGLPERTRFEEEFRRVAGTAGVPRTQQDMVMALYDAGARSLANNNPELGGNVDDVFRRLHLDFEETWKAKTRQTLLMSAERSLRGAVSYDRNGNPRLDVKRLAALVRKDLDEGSVARGWFPNSRRFIQQSTRGLYTVINGRRIRDYELLADILAVTSIGRLPEDQLLAALKVYYMVKDGTFQDNIVRDDLGRAHAIVNPDYDGTPANGPEQLTVREVGPNQAKMLEELANGHLVRDWEAEIIANGSDLPIEEVIRRFNHRHRVDTATKTLSPDAEGLSLDHRQKVRAYAATLKGDHRAVVDRRMGMFFGVFTSDRVWSDLFGTNVSKGLKVRPNRPGNVAYSIGPARYRQLEAYIDQVRDYLNNTLGADELPYSSEEVQSILWLRTKEFLQEEAAIMRRRVKRLKGEERANAERYLALVEKSTTDGMREADYLAAWHQLRKTPFGRSLENRMRTFLRDPHRLAQQINAEIKGASIFGEDFNVYMKLFRSGDITTFIHEYGHALRHLLPSEISEGLWDTYYAIAHGDAPASATYAAADELFQEVSNLSSKKKRRWASFDTTEGVEVREGDFVVIRGEPGFTPGETVQAGETIRGDVPEGQVGRILEIAERGGKVTAVVDVRGVGRKHVPIDKVQLADPDRARDLGLSEIEGYDWKAIDPGPKDPGYGKYDAQSAELGGVRYRSWVDPAGTEHRAGDRVEYLPPEDKRLVNLPEKDFQGLEIGTFKLVPDYRWANGKLYLNERVVVELLTPKGKYGGGGYVAARLPASEVFTPDAIDRLPKRPAVEAPAAARVPNGRPTDPSFYVSRSGEAGSRAASSMDEAEKLASKLQQQADPRERIYIDRGGEELRSYARTMGDDGIEGWHRYEPDAELAKLEGGGGPAPAGGRTFKGGQEAFKVQTFLDAEGIDQTEGLRGIVRMINDETHEGMIVGSRFGELDLKIKGQRRSLRWGDIAEVEFTPAAIDAHRAAQSAARAAEVPAEAPKGPEIPGQIREWYRHQDSTVEALPKQMENRETGFALEAAMDIGREVSLKGEGLWSGTDYVREKLDRVRDVARTGVHGGKGLNVEDTKLAQQIVAGLRAYKGETNPTLDKVRSLVDAIVRGQDSKVIKLLDELEATLLTKADEPVFRQEVPDGVVTQIDALMGKHFAKGQKRMDGRHPLMRWAKEQEGVVITEGGIKVLPDGSTTLRNFSVPADTPEGTVVVFGGQTADVATYGVVREIDPARAKYGNDANAEKLTATAAEGYAPEDLPLGVVIDGDVVFSEGNHRLFRARERGDATIRYVEWEPSNRLATLRDELNASEPIADPQVERYLNDLADALEANDMVPDVGDLLPVANLRPEYRTLLATDRVLRNAVDEELAWQFDYNMSLDDLARNLDDTVDAVVLDREVKLNELMAEKGGRIVRGEAAERAAMTPEQRADADAADRFMEERLAETTKKGKKSKVRTLKGEEAAARLAELEGEAAATAAPEVETGGGASDLPPAETPPAGPIDKRRWTRQMEEAFAEDLERWFYNRQIRLGMEGRLLPAFRTIIGQILETWKKVRGYAKEFQLVPDEAARVFDDYLGEAFSTLADQVPKMPNTGTRRNRTLAGVSNLTERYADSRTVSQVPAADAKELRARAIYAEPNLRAKLTSAFGKNGFIIGLKTIQGIARKIDEGTSPLDALRARVIIGSWKEADAAVDALVRAGLDVVGVEDLRARAGSGGKRGLVAYVRDMENPDIISEVEIGTPAYSMLRESTHELDRRFNQIVRDIRRLEGDLERVRSTGKSGMPGVALQKRIGDLEDELELLQVEHTSGERYMEGVYEHIADEIARDYGAPIPGWQEREAIHGIRMWVARNLESELIGRGYWDFTYAFERNYLPQMLESGARWSEDAFDGQGGFIGGDSAYALDEMRAAAGLPMPVYYPHVEPVDISSWARDRVLQRTRPGARKLSENKHLRRNRGLLFEDGNYITDPIEAYSARAARMIKMRDTHELVAKIAQTYGRRISGPDDLLPGESVFAPDFVNAFFKAVIGIEDRLGALLTQLDDTNLRGALDELNAKTGRTQATDILAAGIRHGLDIGETESGALYLAVSEAIPRSARHLVGVTSQGVEMYAIPKVVARRLEESVRYNMGPAIRLFWDKPTQLWKALTLYARPAWVLNNMFGNTFFAKIGGVKIREILAAALDEDYRFFVDQLGRDAGMSEDILQSFTRGTMGNVNLGVAEDTVAGAAYARLQAKATTGRGGKIMAPFRRYADWMKHVNTELENAYRRLGFVEGLRKADAEQMGVNIDRVAIRRTATTFWKNKEELQRMLAAGINERNAARAMDLTNEWFGDYVRYSPVERNIVRRFLFPFWGFYRHITKLLVKMPFEYPAKTAVMRAMALVAEDLREDYGPVPEWMDGMVPWGPLNPDGSQKFLSVSGPNPFNVFMDAGLSLFHPVIKSTVEMLTGRDAYTGREFSDPDVFQPYGSSQRYRIVRGENGVPIDAVPVDRVVPSLGVELASQTPLFDIARNLAAGGRTYDTSGLIGAQAITDEQGNPIAPYGPMDAFSRVMGSSTFTYDIESFRERLAQERENALMQAYERWAEQQSGSPVAG